MSASIKLNNGADDGARTFAGITAGKSYPVQGFTGGGAIVINDSGKLLHVGFADIDAGWTVTDEAAAKKAEADAAAKKAAAKVKADTAAAETAAAEDQTTTT